VGVRVEWRIWANDTSNNWENTEIQHLTTISGNQAPYSPALTGPANNTRYDMGGSILFEWVFDDPDIGDTQGAYEFELDNDPAFGSPEIDTGKVVSGSESVNQNLPSSIDDYYWRLKTWDDSDEESPWSATRYVIADRVRVKHIEANDTRNDVAA
ncbi:unnamed protein product, partial [marine sediment metagenome]